MNSRRCLRLKLRVRQWSSLWTSRRSFRRDPTKWPCWTPTGLRIWPSHWGRWARHLRRSARLFSCKFVLIFSLISFLSRLKYETRYHLFVTFSHLEVFETFEAASSIHSCDHLAFQVWPADSAGGLCGVLDALPAHRERDQSPATVREGAQASGEPDGRGPLHDAVQQDWAAHAEDDHHGLHRQLQWKRSDAHAGKCRFGSFCCCGCCCAETRFALCSNCTPSLQRPSPSSRHRS